MKSFVLFILLLFASWQGSAQTIQLMVVTGGHNFDSLEFFQLFDEMTDVEFEHFEQPKANQKIAIDLAKDFDVIVFYDMWQEIGENEKTAYLRMLQQGKPMLFLHHSIVSYQNWPAFEEMLGGKYVLPGKDVPEEALSDYEHDVWQYCSVENYTPVTLGFRELRFFDEIYENVRISDNVYPLLRIRHPKSMIYLAWENRFQNSKILYIQPGHDKRTFQQTEYRKLLYQAIKYLAEK